MTMLKVGYNKNSLASNTSHKAPGCKARQHDHSPLHVRCLKKTSSRQHLVHKCTQYYVLTIAERLLDTAHLQEYLGNHILEPMTTNEILCVNVYCIHAVMTLL